MRRTIEPGRIDCSIMPALGASEDARERAYVAGIHVFLLCTTKTWMAGTSPAMTSLIVRLAFRVAQMSHFVMPGLVPGIHVFLLSIFGVHGRLRRGWHRNSGLPEFRTIKCRKSGKPDLR